MEFGSCVCAPNEFRSVLNKQHHGKRREAAHLHCFVAFANSTLQTESWQRTIPNELMLTEYAQA